MGERGRQGKDYRRGSERNEREIEWKRIDENTVFEFPDGRKLPALPFIMMELERAITSGDLWDHGMDEK